MVPVPRIILEQLEPHTRYSFFVVAYNERTNSDHSLTVNCFTMEDGKSLTSTCVTMEYGKLLAYITCVTMEDGKSLCYHNLC